MKIKLKVSDKTVLLSVEQYEQILSVLCEAEEFSSKYVGNDKGDNGTNYATVVRPLDVAEVLEVKTLPDGEYEAIRLKVKMNPDLLK